MLVELMLYLMFFLERHRQALLIQNENGCLQCFADKVIQEDSVKSCHVSLPLGNRPDYSICLLFSTEYTCPLYVNDVQ